MPNSVINTLKISFGKMQEEAVLLSICSTEKNVSKYYLDVAQDDPRSEITKTKFEQLKKIINRARCVAITIFVKDVETVSFQANTSEGNRTITVYPFSLDFLRNIPKILYTTHHE